MGQFNLRDIYNAELLYLLDGNKSDADVVRRYREELTPRGFEFYVKYFFEKKQGYKMKLGGQGSTYEPDNCIDIEGVNVKTGNTIIVQCKKIFKKLDIHYIREFYGAVVSRKMYDHKMKLYIITTSHYIPKNVREFARKNQIIIKDYKNILNMERLVSLDDFKEYISASYPNETTLWQATQLDFGFLKDSPLQKIYFTILQLYVIAYLEMIILSEEINGYQMRL